MRGGITPITVNGSVASVIVRPTIAGSAPKLDVQSAWLNTSTR